MSEVSTMNKRTTALGGNLGYKIGEYEAQNSRITSLVVRFGGQINDEKVRFSGLHKRRSPTFRMYI